MTRHDKVLNVEIAMNSEDGTYRLQAFAPGDDTSPRETVFDADTIPAGLRMLAATMEAAGAVFGRRQRD
jgi:hypothetical protein